MAVRNWPGLAARRLDRIHDNSWGWVGVVFAIPASGLTSGLADPGMEGAMIIGVLFGIAGHVFGVAVLRKAFDLLYS